MSQMLPLFTWPFRMPSQMLLHLWGKSCIHLAELCGEVIQMKAAGTGVISPVWCPQTDKNSHCCWWHQWESPRHLGGTHHRCLHQHHSRHKIVQLWNILHSICNKCQLEWFDCYKGEYSECQKDPGHNAVPLTCMTLANHRVAVLHCTHSTKWYLGPCWLLLCCVRLFKTFAD